MPERTIFRGVRMVDPVAGRDDLADVVVAGEHIESVEAAGKGDGPGTTLDGDGLILAPGFVDLHCHLREPGWEDRETVETGSRSAAVGGFTAVAAMANTDPVADNAAVIQEVLTLGEKAGLCDVFPVGAITMGLVGEVLTEIGEMADLGVRIFSDDGRCVPRSRVLRMALEYARAFDVVIAEHCEDTSLSEGTHVHEGPTSELLGLAGHPAEAEVIIVARDLALAALTGGRLHLCHLSAAGSVELVRRAKEQGVRVSAEVTPHHLVMTDEDLTTYDTRLKVNPPVRLAEDRQALVSGLADGTIDAIATDHAPHAVQDKEVEFDLARHGTIGLETALAVILTHLVEPRHLPLARALEALSASPARILGAADHGGPIEPGRPANIVVFDPAAEWVVQPPFVSKSQNSAFIGQMLRGRVVHTMYRGELVVREGEATR